MKAQTLFLVASTFCGVLAAPVGEREAKVITVYEKVVHVVTVTCTTWVSPSAKTTLDAAATSTTTPKVHGEEKTTPTANTYTQPTPTPAATTSSCDSTYASPKPTETEAPKGAESVTPASTYPISSAEPEPTEPATPNPKSAPAPGDVIKGKATFYSPGMGSCGITSSGDEHIVAISGQTMNKYGDGNPNHNPICGKRIKCTRGGKEVVAKVVDTCPECEVSHVDLSPSAFNILGEPVEGIIPIEWYWLDPLE